jgi:hypothetical protein
MSFSAYILKVKVYLVDLLIVWGKLLIKHDCWLAWPFTKLVNLTTTSSEFRVHKLINTASLLSIKTVLLESQFCETAEPKGGTGKQNIVRHKVPEIGYLVFNDALIDSRTPIVRVESDAIVQSTSSEALVKEVIKTNYQLYKEGPIHIHGAKLAWFQALEVKHIENGVFLCGSHGPNWYHVLIEILPILLLIERLPNAYKNFPILVSENVLKYATSKEVFSRLLGKRDFITMERGFSYKIGTCVYVESPVLGPAKVAGKMAALPEEQHFRKDVMLEFKNRLISTFSRDELTKRDSEPTKIFLARHSHSVRSYNQEEVFGIFETYGFEQVYCEDLTLAEQIRLFKHAQWVAGPTGAAWSNLLFCNPKTKGLCLTPEYVNSTFACFSNIAHAFEVDLNYYFEPCSFVNQEDMDYSEKEFIYIADDVSKAVNKVFETSINLAWKEG